jgi:VWFA-related protein
MSRRAQFLAALALVSLSSVLALAQAGTDRNPPSLNAPAAPVATQSPQPQAQSNPVSTLKANAQLVIVDVLVTDSKQQPIHNLKASDFTVTENGSPQQIVAFDEHVTPPPTTNAPTMPRLPPGIFTNYTPVPAGSAVNVLLLDALNTPMKDQAYVRDQLREFLKNTPAGTRIAIFGLNDRLVMLQGFTSNLALLKSVVDRSAPGSSRQLPDNVGNGGTKAPSEMMTDVMGDATDMTQLVASVQQFEAAQGAIDIQNRVIQTMQAVNQIARFLSGIPGRKNLIWFSGSFPLDIFPDNTIANPAATVVNMEDEFHETTNLLARAQVAVYPIDAGGLQTNNVPIANDSSPASSGPGLSSALAKQFVDRTSRQSTMYQVAADTGGRAYFDANSLSKAVGTAIESGSNYYTLSYVPSNSAQDGKFRKIQVKLAQQGPTLTYRSGYYAGEPAGKSKQLPELAALSTQPNSLTRAMMRGAPDATDIMLKLQVLPASTDVEQKVVPGNIFNTEPAAKLKIEPPFRRYAIDIAAAARDIHITPTPDGHYLFSVEVITCVYNGNGVLINTAVQKAHGNLSPSTFANLRHTGLPFHQEISVPVAGEYFLRTSVHDLDTDRYGSVEIPVASVAKLAPLPAAASR